jgi:hypothetical protein
LRAGRVRLPGRLGGVGGGLEVDAEGIAAPAAHW